MKQRYQNVAGRVCYAHQQGSGQDAGEAAVCTAHPTPTLSRRSALGSSGLALLGVLSGSALSQTENQEGNAKGPAAQPPRESQKSAEKAKALMERMQNAGSGEERRQAMNELMASQRQIAIESLRNQLRVSDQEWAVVKPRLVAVYDLVRPAVAGAGRNEPPKSELEQRSRDLRELLQADKAEADQIKAKLTAFRAAKEKANQQLAGARQSLRQIMNLRQEAVLVVNGLLD
ncbi:MAG: hypothetical protein NTZ17_19545 [Phycisphaerae bacterium]|nr:hypothetical protein [Phycisphaerae bacterium]